MELVRSLVEISSRVSMKVPNVLLIRHGATSTKATIKTSMKTFTTNLYVLEMDRYLVEVTSRVSMKVPNVLFVRCGATNTKATIKCHHEERTAKNCTSMKTFTTNLYVSQLVGSFGRDSKQSMSVSELVRS